MQFKYQEQKNGFEEDDEDDSNYSKPTYDRRIVYLALCFLVLFSMFHCVDKMIAQIYEQLGYGYVAYVKMLIYWITFGVGSVLAPYCARRFGYKNCLIMGACGFFVLT